MGIFGAMTTAVSGLKAQSYAMENISGNIANSRTTGFKRVDTSFVDLIPDRPVGQELGGSVRGFALSTNTIQGDLSTTGIAENIAINGSGFFVVSERTGYAGGVPTFGGIDVYTRRGDFQLDNSSYLVNSRAPTRSSSRSTRTTSRRRRRQRSSMAQRCRSSP